MAQGKKTDTKTKAKVLKEKIKNVDLTLKDIEERTGVSNSVVSSILRDNLGKLREESQVIADIIDGDKTIIELGGIIEQQHFFDIVQKLSNGHKLETHEVKALAEIREKAGRRYMLLKGDVTSPEGGLLTDGTKSLVDDSL